MQPSSSIQPCEGIYFVVRAPGGWTLLFCRFDAGEDPSQRPITNRIFARNMAGRVAHGEDQSHHDYWRFSGAPRLGVEWLEHWKNGSKRISDGWSFLMELEKHYDGFPRGRVARELETGRHHVYHGGNLMPFMKIQRREIERVFGIHGQAVWTFDEHEQCSAESRDAVIDLLQLKESWPCAGEPRRRLRGGPALLSDQMNRT